MVSWQDFTRLGFRVAENKGASFENIADGGDFVASLSRLWNEDKERLKQRINNVGKGK